MNRMNKGIALGVMLAICLFQLPASAAESLKVGLVNFKTCAENSKIGKEEQEKFEAFKKQMEGVMAEKEKALSDIAKKFNDPDYLDSLSSDAEAELKHQFRTLNQEYNQQQTQFYQALQQANFKIVQSLSDSVAEASKQVAKAKGYDVILNDESAFFNNPKLDISEEIIAMMNQMFEKESKEK